MVLAITATDGQNGTVTVTITGTDPGSANTVNYWPLAQGGTVYAWNNGGVRLGDGQVTVSLAPGFYWVQVVGTVSGSPATSSTITACASRAGEGVYKRILVGIQARIQSLNLTGLDKPPGDLPPKQVYEEGFVDAGLGIFPSVWVTTPETGSKQIKPVVNSADDLGWPFVVSITDRADVREYKKRVSTYFAWHETISNKVRFQRIPGLENLVYNVTEDPMLLAGWRHQENSGLFFTSTLGFRAWVRTQRG